MFHCESAGVPSRSQKFGRTRVPAEMNSLSRPALFVSRFMAFFLVASSAGSAEEKLPLVQSRAAILSYFVAGEGENAALEEQLGSGVLQEVKNLLRTEENAQHLYLMMRTLKNMLKRMPRSSPEALAAREVLYSKLQDPDSSVRHVAIEWLRRLCSVNVEILLHIRRLKAF